MTNTNIQADIPLVGRGLAYKPLGNYRPGEYKVLSNVEITPEGIRTRRSIKSSVLAEQTDSNGIIGNSAGKIMTVSLTNQYAWGVGSQEPLWAPTSLTVPAPVGSYHRIRRHFKYNNLYYWVTDSYDGTTLIHTYKLYQGPAYNSVFAALTLTALLFTETGSTSVINAVIFKDRLFILTNKGLYYSKATDPTVFAVPNGGFILMPKEDLKGAVFINDSVYLLSRNIVHVFSYSNDPAEDGTLRPISNNVGGQSICLHQGVPYFSNGVSLYAIQNNNVTKIFDFDSIFIQSVMAIRLRSFNDTIFIIRYKDLLIPEVNDDVSYTDDTVFCFNTETNTISSLGFFDAEAGRIFDATILTDDRVIAIPYEDYFAFITSRLSAAVHKSRVYFMYYPRSEATGVDTIFSSAGVENVLKINQKITLDSFSPDGSELFMKKFRGLLGMADLPESDFELGVAYGNNAESKVISLDDSGVAGAALRPPYPFRIGLNQRARSLTLSFRTKNPLTVVLSTAKHMFELSNLKMFWTHTQRAPITKDDGK